MSLPSEPAPLDDDSAAAESLAGIGAVAVAFRNAVTNSLGDPEDHPNPIVDRLRDHFGGADPRELPIVTQGYVNFFQLNFQAALDEFLAAEGRESKVVGAFCPSAGQDWTFDGSVSLSTALLDSSLNWAPAVMTPAEYDLVESGCESQMLCLRRGLVLFRDGDGPGAIWAYGPLSQEAWVVVDVMHASAERATEILASFYERGLALNPYRGQVIDVGFEFDVRYPRRIRFLPRPAYTAADEVILPAGLLEQIEEHTIDIVNARSTLEEAGCHLKRGVLLHGRPGTGKTHTIRYLISQIPDATVLVMSSELASEAERVDIVHQVVDVIQPGVVIFDDVDFIAEDRSLPGMTSTRDALFSLLDLLDGIDEDADLLFVLTTNRPNMLEPAVAARPGRIDQAIEVPLPDADCRRRLIELYTRKTTLEASNQEIDEVVERTEGVTASLIREIVRRAAAEFILADGTEPEKDDVPVTVTGTALLAALDEMLDPSGPMSSLLRGAEPEHAHTTLAAQLISPDGS